MKNFIQKGDVIDMLLAADVLSGLVVVSGGFVGVAVTDGLSGETIAVRISGVVELPKASGALTLGEVLFWHTTNDDISDTITGSVFIGYAAKAHATGDTLALVYLARPDVVT